MTDGQPQALNDMLPGDTEDYSAWVERLEPIARQRVGWMHDRITELTDRLRAAEAALDEARSEIMRLQDNDSAYDVGYSRADAAAGAALDWLRQERDEASARLAAVEAERDQAVASAARWHGHYRHAGKVIARLQRAIQTYWSACRAEQAVADADDWSPETAHAAGLATQNARDGLWRALNLPSPRATDAFAADPAPTAEEYSNG